MMGCFWNGKFIWAFIQFDLAYIVNLTAGKLYAIISSAIINTSQNF